MWGLFMIQLVVIGYLLHYIANRAEEIIVKEGGK